MPDGVVQWFDEESGRGRILHRGKRYECRAEEMPASSRVSGARVHFDISGHGAEAVSITTTGRGRMIPRDVTEFGGPSSVAARRGTTPSPADLEMRRIVKPTAIQLAHWWATSLATGSIDDVMAMYSPTAVVHVESGEVTGHDHVRALLESSALHGCARYPDTVRGDGDEVVLTWSAAPETPATTTRLRIEHGEIASQWLGPSTDIAPGPPSEESFPMQIVLHGRVGAGLGDRAAEKVRHVVRLVGEPVLFARVKLVHLDDPAAKHPAIAEAAIDVNGALVRAHGSADRMVDAIDVLERRLEDRLRHHRERRDWVRPTGVPPEPGEWRHGNLAASRTAFMERPRDERTIVRHKTWSGDDATVDEAICDLESLDHGFHMFRELATGQDSLISRAGDGTYRLQQLVPDAVVGENTVERVTVDPHSPPTSTIAEAIERLDLSGEGFVFFKNTATGRGDVVYRRYDGNYGLITPAV